MSGLELVERAAEGGANELTRVQRWLRAVRARSSALPPSQVSYLLVTPLGLPDRQWLWDTLSACGAVILGRRDVPAWPQVATALYVRQTDGETLRRAVLFEHAWERLFPGARAEAWTLAAGSHARVEAVKPAVRSGMRHLRVDLGPATRQAVLHPFHLADACDAAAEARRLVAALSLLEGSAAAPHASAVAGARALSPAI